MVSVSSRVHELNRLGLDSSCGRSFSSAASWIFVEGPETGRRKHFDASTPQSTGGTGMGPDCSLYPPLPRIKVGCLTFENL